MTNIFFQILFIVSTVSSSFSVAFAMDDGLVREPGAAENNASKRSCGLGLSRLSPNNDVIDLSDEAKRAWGLYRSALWRKEVLEESLSEVIEKFRNYGNACVSLVREKHCREQSESSDPLPLDVTAAYKKALDELTYLLGHSDLSLLETLAYDKEHRVYKLTVEHELAKGLLEVKPFNPR